MFKKGWTVKIKVGNHPEMIVDADSVDDKTSCVWYKEPNKLEKLHGGVLKQEKQTFDNHALEVIRKGNDHIYVKDSGM